MNEKTTHNGAVIDSSTLVGCPLCGTPNNDNWPVEVDGKIVEGGCQDCWEKQSDAAWWEAVIAMDKLTSNASHEPSR